MTCGFGYFIKIYLCMSALSACKTAWKRASDPITDGCEQPCGCWGLNSGPLGEQSVPLNIEPSLQPPQSFCLFVCFCFVFLRISLNIEKE